MNDKLTLKTKLRAVYGLDSKHARYQNIPLFVQEALGYAETIDENWRGDTARYQYLLDQVTFADGVVVGDVGANTGFFTLSLAHAYPNGRFIAYESNPVHAQFIRQVADYFAMPNVEVAETAVDLQHAAHLPPHDVLLHFNVLHHAGHDFDQPHVPSLADFDGYAVNYLTGLRTAVSQALVFQMGSNWGGQKTSPIIGVKDDLNKVNYMANLLDRSGWQVSQIALATRDWRQQIVYKKLPPDLVAISCCAPRQISPEQAQLLETEIAAYDLDQFPGEFYRRPLIVCSPKNIQDSGKPQ